MIASSTGSTTTIASSFSTSITQSFSNIKLVPVSSVDGKNFYALTTGTVDSTGTATSASFTQQTTTTEANGSDASTAVTAYALDYVFQLKATNPDSSEQTVAITTLNLTSPLTATNGSENAFRVAVLSETYSTAFKNGTPSSAASVYAPTGAEYNTSSKAISSIDNGSATYGDVTINSSTTKNSIGSVSSSSTAYFKVWVRLWLEGEDKSCYNDLFLSSGDWSLNLTVEMGTPKSETVTDGIEGVSALGVTYTSSQAAQSSNQSSSYLDMENDE